MSLGTVKWFNEKKGFGFITPDEGGGDVFVLFASISAKGTCALVEGQRVEYEAQEGSNGKEAVKVRSLQGAKN